MVTVPVMRATYARLRMLKPFSRWKLPAPEQVKFELLDDTETWAEIDNGTPYTIRFSKHKAWTLYALDSTMAHEMIHLRQVMQGKLHEKPDKHHDKNFCRMAVSVCKELGFDPEKFS